MKDSRKIITGLLLAAGFASAGASAYANPEGYGPGWGGHHYGMAGPGMMGAGAMGPQMMGGDHRGAMGSGMAGARGDATAHLEARLAFLKTQFRITPDQESAWQAYAQQARQQAESMQASRAQAPAAAQTAPERLSQRTEFMKRRSASMESMSVALTALYAVLTPEQKTIADRYFGGARLSQSEQHGYRHGR